MPDIVQLIQSLVSGVGVGLIYGLVGIGFCVIYNASGIVNFAQGVFVMLGGFNVLYFTLDHEPWTVGPGDEAPLTAKVADACWDRFAQAHPGEALAQIRAWLAEMADHVASTDERGCALANAAVELPEKDHPARRVIEEFKVAQRTRLIRLCRVAGLSEPDMLADELHLLLEGARVTSQSVGSDGLGARLMRMGEAMLAAHAA